MRFTELRNIFIESIGSQYDQREATQIFFMVLEMQFNLTRASYIVAEGEECSTELTKGMTEIANKLVTGKPVQYVINKAFFDGQVYFVNENVLIPRPETEDLVHWIAQNEKHNARFIDIGSGSGCIQIALSRHLDHSCSLGVDVSSAALEVAKENARLLSRDSSCQFEKLDVLTEKIQDKFPDWSKDIDFIVSNPPYISPDEIKEMSTRVTANEPHLALFSEDHMAFYRAIVSQGCHILSSGGRLYFEVHEHHAEEVHRLMSELYVDISINKDLQGKPRMVRGAKK